MLEPIVETKDYCQNELAATAKECVVQGDMCLNTECIDFMLRGHFFSLALPEKSNPIFPANIARYNQGGYNPSPFSSN